MESVGASGPPLVQNVEDSNCVVTRMYVNVNSRPSLPRRRLAPVDGWAYLVIWDRISAYKR